MTHSSPTLSLRPTRSWRRVAGEILVVVAVCGAGLAFIDHGNGNYEPPGARIWWLCLYVIVVAPPFLIITKALARHPRWRIVAVCLWLAFAVWFARTVWWTYYFYLLATW